ncbi:MAG: hypothetical protein ACK559_19790, partial [bacterium]
MGSLLECLHHRDVVHGALPLFHLLGAYLLEHASFHRLVELLVELLGAAFPSQPLLLVQCVPVD